MENSFGLKSYLWRQKKYWVRCDCLAKKIEELGAGEILLTSIDRDGTKDGYDILLTNENCSCCWNSSYCIWWLWKT